MIKELARISIIVVVPVIGFLLIKQSNGRVYLSPPEKSQDLKATVIRVIDADTIDVKIDKKIYRVRLIGIDAPESHQNPKAEREAGRSGIDLEKILAMGEKATEFARSIVKKGDKVSLELDVQRQDKYGRLLAYVYLEDGRMLNEIIIQQGYAKTLTIPPNVKYAERFMALMEEARENAKGLWDTQY